MSARKKVRRDDGTSSKKPVWIDDQDKDSEEEHLEDMLFGSKSFKQSHRLQDEITGLEHVEDSDLFFFDTGAVKSRSERNEESNDDSDSDDEMQSDRRSEAPVTPKTRDSLRPKANGPVWEDPDDQQLQISISSDRRLRKLRIDQSEDVITGSEYEQRLRQQFETINPLPEWAAKARRKRTRDEMEGHDGVIINSTTGGILSTGIKSLEKGSLEVERLRDANQASPTEGDVKSIMFHPSPTVSLLLSAGGDRRLKLFTVDGHTNPLLQTVHIPSLPISSAVFHPSGSSILLTGPRPFFFNYDLQSGACTRSPRGLWGTFASKPDDVDKSLEINAFSPSGEVLAVAGRRGYVHLVDWTVGSPQVVASLKMNTPVKSLWWNTASSSNMELCSLGENSEVYVWDVRSRACQARWKDDGGYGATTIVGSPNNEYTAIGSKSGLVNVYDSRRSSEPKLLKAIGNLTTAISSLHFNHSSELLVMSSRLKKSQLRLVHLPSLTVFSNWPTSSTPVGKATATAFSHNSEYLAIGNSRGRVLLYGMRHFWNT